MFIASSLILRLVHVVSSVCWAGGGFVQFLFLEPTAKALGEGGMLFMQHLIARRRFNIFMVLNSTLTVLTGALLIWQRSNFRFAQYMSTGPGLGFTLGSAVGVLVYFVGMIGIAPRAAAIGKLGGEIRASGKPPSAVQAAQLTRLDREMALFSQIDFALVALSLALMATARYWIF